MFPKLIKMTCGIELKILTTLVIQWFALWANNDVEIPGSIPARIYMRNELLFWSRYTG